MPDVNPFNPSVKLVGTTAINPYVNNLITIEKEKTHRGNTQCNQDDSSEPTEYAD